MVRIRNLSGVLLIAVLHISCSRVETFDAAITELLITSDPDNTIALLKLDPPSRSGKTLFLSYAKDPRYSGAEPVRTVALWIGEEPGFHDREVKLVHGNTAMEARDLRVGQQLVVHYSRYPQSKVETGPLEIKNYDPPTKFLKLSISILPGAKESPEAIESLLRTKLSWRLPADVGFIQADEASNNGPVIGTMDVTYTSYTEKTQWMYRSTVHKELLIITTQMSDPLASSNWAKIKAWGGFTPVGQDASDYAYKDPFVDVPLFVMNLTQ